MSKSISKTSVENLKKKAKAMSGVPHRVALDIVAKEAGYESWRHLSAAAALSGVSTQKAKGSAWREVSPVAQNNLSRDAIERIKEFETTPDMVAKAMQTLLQDMVNWTGMPELTFDVAPTLFSDKDKDCVGKFPSQTETEFKKLLQSAMVPSWAKDSEEPVKIHEIVEVNWGNSDHYDMSVTVVPYGATYNSGVIQLSRQE